MAHTLEATLQQLLEPSLSAMGYALVQLKVTSSATPVLQIMAERADGKRMDISDCEAITHRASAMLDVEDVIASAYTLEVMSPGIDRPLTRLKDYETYRGHEAKVETLLPMDGRKRFRGVLKGVKCEEVTITCDGVDVTLPFNQIRSAKLVLTDALMKSPLPSPLPEGEGIND